MGTCGRCKTELEQWERGVARLLLCTGCGIVVGLGAAAAKVINGEIAAGRATRFPAALGAVAMQLGARQATPDKDKETDHG